VIELVVLSSQLITGYLMPVPETDKSSASILTEQSSQSNSAEVLCLSDVSPQDKPWDKHRGFADRVQSHYAGSKFERYSERVSFCSQILEFGMNMAEDDTLRLKLRSAKFCRVRHCPVCQWRRSLMWKAKAYQVLPKITSKYPTHRWLFMTLTQKNVPITELRETLINMNKGFKRMVERKMFPAVGWLRSMEVTRGRDGNAHPHFHCLLMVPASYFGKGYIKQHEWAALWRDCMRLDYNPIMDIQAVRLGTSPSSLIPELLKYCTKESDMVADREWFLELTSQLHKMRAIATGGVLKEYLQDLEDEPDDLIGEGDDELSEDYGRLLFGWKKEKKKYQIIKTVSDSVLE
jgi:plasmid rolling circle replication initiator protein Rep